MEDSSFLYLTNDETISKIDIDPRLIDSFKRVMQKIQLYFNANGYTSQRDYSTFLEEFLLKDIDGKLKIQCNNGPSKIGAAGLYWPKSPKEFLLIIDESVLETKNNDFVDSTLCHEFIHFLVMRSKHKYDSDVEIDFTNEALTEMLTQQIYPNSHAYEPQVSMMKFANLLTNKVNNYSMFLRGSIDSKGGASSWNNFISLVSEYQNQMKGKSFKLKEAIQNPLYIKAQRYIIEANIHPHLLKNFQDYERCIEILNNRPVPDNDRIEDFKNRMDKFLINNLGIHDLSMQKVLLDQLKRYRTINEKLEMYDEKDVIEFEILGRTIAFDENQKIYGNTIYTSYWDPNTGIFKIQVGNEIKSFSINNLDFKRRKKKLLDERSKISKKFTSNLLRNAKAVMSISKNKGLIKLECFELPIVGSTKFDKNYIYIATYEDRIEILDSAKILGKISDVNSSKYIGLTSMTNGAIYLNHVGQIENGIVFTALNNKQLINKSIQYLVSRLKERLTTEDICNIINNYIRKNNDVDGEEFSLEDLRELALTDYAKQKFDSMSSEEKNSIMAIVTDLAPKYIISTTKGNVEVSVLFGNEYTTAFLGESETLISRGENGVWDSYYAIVEKSNNEISNMNQRLNIDINGNINFDGLSYESGDIGVHHIRK